MTPPLVRRAWPLLLLANLVLTGACTSSPVAAGSPTSDPRGGETGRTGGTIGGGGSSPGIAVAPAAPLTGGPDDPASSSGGGGAPIDPDASWQPTSVTPGLHDLRPQAWDHLSVAPDGRTVTVYFWGGVDTCYGLGDVRVTAVNGVPTITLLTGARPLPANTACIDIAVGYRTTITLDQPIMRDGSQAP